jgi:4-oxalomesaconate tautomerase
MLRSIPCTIMRGGTSKGLYFNTSDLPSQPAARDRVLLAALGSPDTRQIDGMGGAHPLTSKVALVSKSSRMDTDVDYLFLQVAVDKPVVSDSQNCGNLLAGVGPFAIERGWVNVRDGVTPVRVHMLNTASVAIAQVPTPAGVIEYEGETRIDGVPGTAAAISLDFSNITGSSCGALLPTGRVLDIIENVAVTCIDNGMPLVVIDAAALDKRGDENPAELEADIALKTHIERIRIAAGKLMNLGDVSKKTVPKITLVSKPLHGGAINTRTFIPHRVHDAIGVFGAISVATACLLPGSTAAPYFNAGKNDRDTEQLEIEHPSGFFNVILSLEITGRDINIRRTGLIRTTRKLMQGEIYIPQRAWSGA